MSRPMLTYGTMPVPWNAAWSSEQRFHVQPCRWAGGEPAIYAPHRQGTGVPVFAKPHPVRQRRSVAEYLCTVCGERTPRNDRWWFNHGEFRDGYFMTQEAPVHEDCGRVALAACPHLRGMEARFERFPLPHTVLMSVVGGPRVEADFGLSIQPGRRVIGAMKFAWPASAIRFSSDLPFQKSEKNNAI